MSNIIEELYYGNIEPQQLNSELSGKLSKKLNVLTATRPKKQNIFSL